ncbi:transcription factor bHLH52 [Sesamum indicum]|uniref:Transcription factor bHLH52 n=1 Tax=Sesamum indicum TaxID=4182 RepID=A0A8M8VD39_SESIN|nr:transcription factor bHLH52 [Sesamum indicum]
MALSYYSNWGAFQQLDADIMSFVDPLQTEAELPPEPLPFPNIDHLFETNDLFYSECSNSLLYDFSTSSTGVTSDNLNCIPTQPCSLQQEFEPHQHNPKRQKAAGCGYEDIYTQMFNPPHFNGLVPNTCLTQLQDYLPTSEVVVLPLPDFSTPPGFSYSSESPKKEASAGGSLSAQSIAARQRRRKITEKTQELGKLVPGGRKMNTAEMLQAAYKYIKYLQAQVGVLESMSSNNQNREGFESDDELRVLLESPLIQEKLYSTERCLVPAKFVQHLSSDHEIVKSNPQLLPLIVKQEQ